MKRFFKQIISIIQLKPRKMSLANTEAALKRRVSPVIEELVSLSRNIILDNGTENPFYGYLTFVNFNSNNKSFEFALGSQRFIFRVCINALALSIVIRTYQIDESIETVTGLKEKEKTNLIVLVDQNGNVFINGAEVQLHHVAMTYFNFFKA